jgi:hypothetical protein
MRDLLILFIHLIVTVVRLARPGGLEHDCVIIPPKELGVYLLRNYGMQQLLRQ